MGLVAAVGEIGGIAREVFGHENAQAAGAARGGLGERARHDQHARVQRTRRLLQPVQERIHVFEPEGQADRRRNRAQGNRDKHRSMVVESNA